MSDSGPLPLPEPTQADLRALEIGVDDLLREAAGETPAHERHPGIVSDAASRMMQLWMEGLKQESETGERFEKPRSEAMDLNPNVKYDPAKSSLENMMASYDGKPPQSVIEWATYLDVKADLLDQLQKGEISEEEFNRLHDQAADTVLKNDETPFDEPW